MKEEEKILSKQEKIEQQKEEAEKDGWFDILMDDQMDRIRFISTMLLDPGIVILFVYYISGIVWNIPLVYFIVDILILIWWENKALEKRRKLEEEQDAGDRREIIMQKIEELKVIEQQRAVERQKRAEEEQRKAEERIKKKEQRRKLFKRRKENEI